MCIRDRAIGGPWPPCELVFYLLWLSSCKPVSDPMPEDPMPNVGLSQLPKDTVRQGKRFRKDEAPPLIDGITLCPPLPVA